MGKVYVEPKVASASEGSAPSGGRSLFVLIIEDHPDGRESLSTLLNLYGHHVEVAVDGVEGVEKALQLQPDVALVDIGRPRLDGYDVARQLRHALGTKIRLRACTAYNQPEDQAKALEAGFDGLMVKPLDLDRLIAWLEQIAAS